MYDSFEEYQAQLKELCAYCRLLLSAADADARLLDALYKVMPNKGKEFMEVSIATSSEHDKKLQAVLKKIFEHTEGRFNRLAVAAKYIYSGTDLPALSPSDCKRIAKELE